MEVKKMTEWLSCDDGMASYPGLEAAVELGEVGVAAGEGQDALLSHSAVHVIVLEDHVLLQDFDGINFI